MPEKPLILVGGGGHCKSCIDVIESSGEWKIMGILEQETQQIGATVLGYKVIGTNDHIAELAKDGNYFLVTVGQVRSAVVRKKIFELLLSHQAMLATVISGKAKVSRFATLGAGTIVHHMAIVNAGAVVGKNNIINTGANIEHDVETGHHTHISTGAILNGDVTVGNECFIGSRSIVIQGTRIADNIVVGAGSLVLNDLHDMGLYAGSPCKKMQK